MAACPACGKELPGEFPFCPFCTAPLTEQPAPPSVEERKVVSVLFCDLVGFTAASEAADPEDVRARLRPYHEQVRDVLERHGGTVEKFVGDAVMAVFGAPVAHEDDPERAVRAGLRILEAIAELNEADPALGLQVRVGVNTGEAVVTLAARPDLGEAMVTGDVVNTASRLQGAAPVNGVAVSEQTHRATERAFDWEPLGPVTVKGKAQPLPLWRPLQARARFGLEVTRTHSTPLVGRELEKPLLVGAFERAAAQQSCQLVTVVGEPGVGKSRLCAELLGYVEERPGLVRWRQGRCLPYGDGIALWALGEIVKAECGVLETDTPDGAAAKLDHALPADHPDRAWLLARLAPLVGAGGESAAQEESFAAWRRFCEGLAAERITVLVFEDLHWADPALLAFLEYLADWAEGVPLLLLCTARPELYEHHPGFGTNARNATRINLAPLTDAETATLVSALLERAVLPVETQQELLERAGGNPLYAEEFVRLLADRDLTHKSAEVPESVQALIAARLDTLTPDRKSLLQDAAVVGKVFWAGALAEMGHRDLSEVEQALHELARKELVRPARTSSMAGETEYGFWHALVRDVCYGQISRRSRVARHETAAAWLERKAGERVEDLADVLAHHYRAAFELSRAAGIGADAERLQAQAVHCLALAGERALSLDVDQAERQLALALELDPSGTARASVLERWAQAVQQQGRLHEAREALGQALDIYRREGDVLAAGRTLPRLALVLHRLGDPSAEEATTEAVELLEQQQPGPELVTAYAYRAGRLTLTNRYELAAAAAQQAITLAAELSLPEPAFALHWRGLARCALRDAAGVDDMRRALQLALEQGLGRETAVIYGNLAGVCGAFEGPRAGLDLTREALAFNERRGIAELLLLDRAGVLHWQVELGETKQPLAEAGLLADELQATGNIGYLSPRALQLRLFAECGQAEQAPSASEFIAAIRELGVRDSIMSAYAAAAALLLAQHRHQEARGLLQELDQLGIPATELGAQLCSVVRVALALDEFRLAERLIAAFEPAAPVDDHALATARAQLAEAAGNHIQAATLYADAADRWQQFGNVPERAYALLGHGRCLTALDDPAGEQPLTQARVLFGSMSFKPALAETQALLDQRQLAAS